MAVITDIRCFRAVASLQYGKHGITSVAGQRIRRFRAAASLKPIV